MVTIGVSAIVLSFEPLKEDLRCPPVDCRPAEPGIGGREEPGGDTRDGLPPAIEGRRPG